jgi:hypothetical protein
MGVMVIAMEGMAIAMVGRARSQLRRKEKKCGKIFMLRQGFSA